MKHGDLFTGIGGFSLAASWMGWETLFQCENNEFCQKVLKYHFPKAKLYNDITTTDFTDWRGRIDILTAGFPCQSFSVAGKQAGDLSLWKEMLRVVKEIQPSFVVAENVPGLITIRRGLLFNEVLTNLEDAGYEVQPVIIPAAGKNAPHKRERVWIVAYSHTAEQRRKQRESENEKNDVSQTNGNGHPVRPDNDGEDNSNAEIQWTGRLRNTSKKERAQSSHELLGINDRNFTNTGFLRSEVGISGQNQRKERNTRITNNSSKESDRWEENWYEVAARFCRVDDGVPRTLDRVNRLKALGNAIIPQVAYEIFLAIMQTNEKLRIKQ